MNHFLTYVGPGNNIAKGKNNNNYIELEIDDYKLTSSPTNAIGIFFFVIDLYTIQFKEKQLLHEKNVF